MANSIGQILIFYYATKSRIFKFCRFFLLCGKYLKSKIDFQLFFALIWSTLFECKLSCPWASNLHYNIHFSNNTLVILNLIIMPSSCLQWSSWKVIKGWLYCFMKKYFTQGIPFQFESSQWEFNFSYFCNTWSGIVRFLLMIYMNII